MISCRIIFPLVLLVGMAACKPTTTNGGQSESDSNTANVSSKIELPPPICASVVYRCTDNSVAHVDFLADDRTINLRIGDESGPVTRLTAPAGGKPFAGAGYEVAGDHTRITLTKPNSAAVTCKT